ncbi:ABC transporter permease [Kibdelosporangium phytohabitans]|uniref:Transport permease protein n=1 Tax=Kibdelosporangium phytohabitans TaxID=860235 RepID=A0A0N9HY84_9PSEU|nr:ABC transporter permease [Kibdelosporangium phytohabitans]ALG10435.1 multidrug ABC transporter permease [Kibdelosporangium phytohabitans]MBE1461506.1 ABC-2 type transport system permease protein [Kibdelosporangium phytohabitans]
MKLIRDVLLVFRRQFGLVLMSRFWIVIGLAQPVMYLVFFGPLVQSALPGENGGWQMFVPGLLVQLGLFGSAFVGFNVISDVRSGVLERMRVTPVSRLALLMGRVLRDVVVLVSQSIVLLIVATVAFGLRAPVGGILLGLLLLALLVVALASLSYTAGLSTKHEDAFAPLLNFVTVPLLLLSGVLLPMSLAPGWLDVISRLNPLRYVVDGIRGAFLGQFTSDVLAIGLVAAVALAVVSISIGSYTFMRENH